MIYFYKRTGQLASRVAGTIVAVVRKIMLENRTLNMIVVFLLVVIMG